MDYLKIRNWGRWQSYRGDRGQPPWIKLHRNLMRNLEWMSLSDAQRGQLVAIWLLAADRDGVIPASAEAVRKLAGMEQTPDLELFISLGFIEPDAVVPSECRRVGVTTTPTRPPRDRDRDRDRREGERARARTSAAGHPVAAPAADTPDKIPPPPAAQGETGKATTADVSATPAQLEMLAGLCTKRALRIPDVCQTLGIALPVPKADVDRIIAHLEAIKPVPPADRKRQRAADQAPVLWSDVSRMLDAGAVTDAHVALRAIVDPVLRRDVQRRLGAYLGERGDLLGAMLAVGSDHETLIRDLPVVWEALLSSKRYGAHDPPGTGVTEGDSRGVAL